jgi:coenzyme F420-reducing hydrogenase gamma subunit
VKNAAGTYVAYSSCDATHLVTGSAGAARFAAMKSRTLDAITYWSARLRVKPVQDSIVIDASIAGC